MNEVLLKKGYIELKTFSLDEADKLYQLIDKNRVQIGERLIWADKTKSVEDVEKMIQEYTERREKGEGINFGIWYKTKLIGVISFASIDKDRRKAGIAYWLDSDYQGKGIITKSCKHLIEYGFNELNLHRIEISCATENSKSRAIPERLGFTKEGTFRESELIRGGKLVDNNYYALLKQDWKK
ncbi:MAG: GNAT family N-acetyltransferase [Candidatus Marinimicrobia bacterium]|nr:GNAT family N-acetyltransferase [Candidatus Neomarinimicrobiota bacterium]